MPQHKLERTGQRPLEIDGELVSSASGEYSAGKEQSRWNELRLYRTSEWLLQIRYLTRWEGETDHSTALECSTLDEVEAALAAYDPCDYVQGYPPYPQFAAKQEALFASLRRRYEALVSELLKDYPKKM